MPFSSTPSWLCLFMLLSLLPSMATAKDWEQVRFADERTEVNVWTRPVEGQVLKAFKGETDVQQSALTALAVMSDVESFPEWVFQTHSAQFLTELGPTTAYIHIKGIWPVSDRDAVTTTDFGKDEDTGVITLHTKAAPDLFPRNDDRVRIPALDNLFILTPLEDGWIRITFETFADPGGAIPKWLANLVAVQAPKVTLTRMAKMMEKPKYQIDSVEEIPNVIPELAALFEAEAEAEADSTTETQTDTPDNEAP